MFACPTIKICINDNNLTHRSYETNPPVHLGAGRCRYTLDGIKKINTLKAKLRAYGLQDPYIDGVATTSGSVDRASEWRAVQPGIIALLAGEMGYTPDDIRVEVYHGTDRDLLTQVHAAV